MDPLEYPGKMIRIIETNGLARVRDGPPPSQQFRCAVHFHTDQKTIRFLVGETLEDA